MFEIDSGSGPVILAAGVNCLRGAETPKILSHGFPCKNLVAERIFPHFLAEIIGDVVTDHPFRVIEWLDQEEPVIVILGDAAVGLVIDFIRRYYIENGDPFNAFDMVQCNR